MKLGVCMFNVLYAFQLPVYLKFFVIKGREELLCLCSGRGQGKEHFALDVSTSWCLYMLSLSRMALGSHFATSVMCQSQCELLFVISLRTALCVEETPSVDTF